MIGKTAVSIIIALLLSAAAVSCLGCGGSASKPSPPTAPASPTTTSASVIITDRGFSPSSFSIPAGTEVIWTNNGKTGHTVTFADADSGTIPPGGSYRQTFPSPGTFDYSCSIHPDITGSVTVEPADGDSSTKT